MSVLAVIGILLVIAWVFGFIVFHVAGFLIHLLLIIGALFLLIGIFRRAV
jgi:hypothetical protein